MHFKAPPADMQLSAFERNRPSWSPDRGRDGVNAMAFWLHKLCLVGHANSDSPHAAHNDMLGGLNLGGSMSPFPSSS